MNVSENSFRFIEKLMRKYRDFLCVLSPTHALTINIPHQSGTFVTIGETKFIHHNHSKSIVCIMGHSLYCIFGVFGHMYMKVSIIISHREFSLS